MEDKQNQECTVQGCTEKRHSMNLCKVHTQESDSERYSSGKTKKKTVQCPLCGGEFQGTPNGNGILPCSKKKNPARYLRCGAFNANGVQCGTNAVATPEERRGR
jgi:hypothetical protein